MSLKTNLNKRRIRNLLLHQKEESNSNQILSDIETNLKIEPFLDYLNKQTFYGDWFNNGKKNIKNFNCKKGKIYITFNHIIYNSHISLLITIKINDGEYNDNYNILSLNFTISKQTLSSDLKFYFSEEKSNYSNISNVSILELKNNLISKLNKGNLFFVNEYQEITINKLFMNITSYEYINGNLISSDLNLNINFSLFSFHNHSLELFNYYMLFCLFCIINFLTNLSILRHCITRKINPKSISPYFIIFNMICNVDSSIISIYLGILYTNERYSFLIPAILSIINFSICEFKILYLSFRAQDEFDEIERQMENNHENNENINFIIQDLFQKQITKLYFIIYSFIFISILLMYFIFTNIFIMYLFVISIFIPQIFYNIKVKLSHNRLPKRIILLSIFDRLFIPLYFKGYKRNFINIKPNLKFCYFSIITILFEILILYLQQKIGNKFFIPKKYRKGYYNYYKKISEIENIFNNDNEKSNQEILICSICLFPIKKNISDNNLEIESIQKLEKQPINILKNEKKRKSYIINCWKNKVDNIYVMLTPCNHLFHPECLKKWCFHKNECPMCRTSLPLIE